MATPARNYHREFERAQYYAGITPMRPSESGRRFRLRIFWEERVAFLLMLSAIVWTVQILTAGPDHSALLRTPGPAELFVLGLGAWCHAKWRRLLKAE